eukprot:NODE_34_length_2456_cov_269.212713_g27_i0.p1 GENE.NODE_34_length_2456_cov_269.212713_g27_i0~~NODE_34_length_2456_cov_269.212713_g27_i0.p1  ORF type:complete len:791 (+),score=-13.86 NODE_34_length_2456_cov_269.212713_g27_i0:25-2373(+)
MGPSTLSTDNSASFKRNNSAASNVTLEELNALQDTSKKPKTNEIDFSKFNFKYNTMDYSSKKEKPKKSLRSDNHSCLSYVLSVAMLQKNRHLLTAGCADILLVMTRVNTPAMCEAIAQTPTCPLPVLTENMKNASANTNNNNSNAKASNNKPSYSLNSGQGSGSKANSNPLTSNIIEWAGLKIMLKFLFRYQQITNQARADSIMRDSVSASLRLKEELLYAHTKVFSAICALIGGSSMVAEFTNTLPGAEQLLQMSSIVHANSNPDVGNEDEQNVQVCLDALARDREDKQLQKAQAEENKLQQLLGSFDASGRKSRTASPSRRRKDSAASPNSPPMKTIGTNIRRDVHSEKVQLTQNMTIDFKGQYDVEQEKGKLYLINTVDGTYANTASDAIQSQLKTIETKKNQTTGLTYQPHGDKLLDSSLEAIDFTTNKIRVETSGDDVLQPHSTISPHLLPPRPGTKHHHHGHNPMYEELDKLDETGQHHGSGNSQSSKSTSASFLYKPKTVNVNLGNITVVDTEALLKNHKFNAKTDFFDQLPNVPGIPTRIEPKTVITPDEEMEAIRQKFSQLADQAVRKIHSGVGYMRNGKNTVSLEEKARRVYSPSKGGVEAMLQSMGITPSVSRPGSKAGSKSGGGSKPGTPGGSIDNLNSTGRFSSFRDDAGNTNVQRAYSPDFTAENEEDDFEVSPELAKTVPWNKNSYYSNDSSNGPTSPSIYGLKLENMDFEGQDLFDNFTPLFDLPVRPLTTNVGVRDVSSAENSSSKKNPGKLKVEMMQSVDIIMQ